MIRGYDGYTAQQFELLYGVVVRPHYSNKQLYIIDNAPGVWRQVADPKVSDPSDRGIVPAIFSGGKIFLVYDVALNAELDVAGLTWKAVATPAIVKAINIATDAATKNPITLPHTAAGDEGGDTDTPKRRRRGADTPPLPTMPLTEPDGSPREGSIIAPIALAAMQPMLPRELPADAPPVPDTAPALPEGAATDAPSGDPNEIEV